MQAFKLKLKRRALMLSVFLVLFIAANILLFTLASPSGETEFMAGFLGGFQFGLAAFVTVVVMIAIADSLRAQRNDAVLKKLYVDETDERKLLIYQKSGSVGMNIVIIGLCAACVLSGYFSQTVFLTLLAAFAFVTFVRAGLKLYYHSRY